MAQWLGLPPRAPKVSEGAGLGLRGEGPGAWSPGARKRGSEYLIVFSPQVSWSSKP